MLAVAEGWQQGTGHQDLPHRDSLSESGGWTHRLVLLTH